jgi:hypothetical protein
MFSRRSARGRARERLAILGNRNTRKGVCIGGRGEVRSFQIV